ncbi:MAG: efflux RND transporter periplasmic adaptor subunit [Pseudomonadota bacterium]
MKRVLTTGKLLVAFMTIGLITACGSDSTESGADPAAVQATDSGTALSVSLVHPTRVLWPEVVTANGSIEAWQEATVNTEVSGARLLEVLVDVGDHVTRGQLLARFDIDQAQAMYTQLEAALTDALAHQAEAAANARRAKQLKANSSVSDQDLIKAVTAELTADAQVQLARARLASQQLVLNNSRVVAPDDGVISSRRAMLGMVAAPGLELFRLIRQNRLEWQAELTAAGLSQVEIGDTAQILLADGKTVTGKVRQISPSLNANTRTGLVYVAIDSEHLGDARTGMFAGGTINTGERAGLALPASTIVQRDGYEYVFVVDPEDGRVAQHKVITGRRFANRVEVDGVVEEEAIVLSGAAFLNDGDRVRIVEQANAGPYTLGST